MKNKFRVQNMANHSLAYYINKQVAKFDLFDFSSFEDFYNKLQGEFKRKNHKFTPSEKKYIKALYTFISSEGSINPNAEIEGDFPF